MKGAFPWIDFRYYYQILKDESGRFYQKKIFIIRAGEMTSKIRAAP